MSHTEETINDNNKVFFEDEEGIYYIDDYLEGSKFKNEDEDDEVDDDFHYYQKKHAS